MSKAFVAGTGMTAFGTFPDRRGRDMFAEAGLAALDDAGLEPADIDEVFYGNFVGTLAENQGHQGPLASEALARPPRPDGSKVRVPRVGSRFEMQSGRFEAARQTSSSPVGWNG